MKNAHINVCNYTPVTVSILVVDSLLSIICFVKAVKFIYNTLHINM